MLSREDIAQNLTSLHAQQDRRARFFWVGLVVLAFGAAVVAYRWLI